MYDALIFNSSSSVYNFKKDEFEKTYNPWSRGNGAHRIASHLRSMGFTCLVVDFCNILSYEEYLKIIQLSIGNNTLIVGFSTTWFFKLTGGVIDSGSSGEMDREVESKSLQRWIDPIKKINNKIKIITGGAFATDLLDTGYIDFAIVGYGEVELSELMLSITKKTKRLFLQKVLDYDKKALSNKELFDFQISSTKYTHHDFIQPFETLGLEIARGCRFKCTFCSYPIIGDKESAKYTKDPDVLRNELLENYLKYGVTKYNIMDETFNDSTEKLSMVADVVKDLPFKPSFWAYIRSDLVAKDPSQIELFKSINLTECYIGVESFNPKSLKVIGKGLDPNKNKEILKRIRREMGPDFSMFGSFIVGLPHETKDSIISTFEWLKSTESPFNKTDINFLYIRQNSTFWRQSQFDVNFRDYGYYFKSTHDDDILWYKDDDTGICSVMEAQSLINNFFSVEENGNYVLTATPTPLHTNYVRENYIYRLIEYLRSKKNTSL